MNGEIIVIIAGGVFFALIAFLFGRIMIYPIKLTFKILSNSLMGILWLTVANKTIGQISDLFIPINWATILITAILGLPGAVLLLLNRLIFG